jgi:hypothetical protein
MSPLLPRYRFCRAEISADDRGVRFAPHSFDAVNLGKRTGPMDGSIADARLGSLQARFFSQPSHPIRTGICIGSPVTAVQVDCDNAQLAGAN